jgi:hypothetical protein
MDLQSLDILKLFFNGLGCANLNYQLNFNFNSDFRYMYLLNSSLIGLETISYVLLIGTNPRLESPLLNPALGKII